jgi:hypothetical protein
MISCTPPCAVVARDRLPDVEAGGQTDAPPAAAVVETSGGGARRLVRTTAVQ